MPSIPKPASSTLRSSLPPQLHPRAPAIRAGGAAAPPVLSILDAENLLVKESFSIPENITGRSVLSAAGDMLYTVSDSGVMIFPVGRMNQQHRLVASVRDVVARGTFCNRNVITQTITITDPGGGNTDFQLSTNTQGVTISPSSGITPAVVQVRVDPTVFQNQNGTLSVALTMTSVTAVNLPPPIRLLINNRNPDQRGTFVNIPGYLTDLLADPVRNRFYIVAQDTDQVLVFDSTNYSQIAALKTSATPTQIAFTFDRKYLLIGHDNAQQAWVYDLDTLQRQAPIQFPSGHYPRSIAESGKTMLALVRNVGYRRPGRDRPHRFRGAPRHRTAQPRHLHQLRESRPACSLPRPTAAPSWSPCPTATSCCTTPTPTPSPCRARISPRSPAPTPLPATTPTSSATRC